MGVVVATGAGDTHLLQHLHSTLPGLGLRDLVVQQDHFCNLISYPCHRVQGSHGILEDHGNLASAHLLHLTL